MTECCTAQYGYTGILVEATLFRETVSGSCFTIEARFTYQVLRHFSRTLPPKFRDGISNSSEVIALADTSGVRANEHKRTLLKTIQPSVRGW